MVGRLAKDNRIYVAQFRAVLALLSRHGEIPGLPQKETVEVVFNNSPEEEWPTFYANLQSRLPRGYKLNLQTDGIEKPRLLVGRGYSSSLTPYTGKSEPEKKTPEERWLERTSSSR